MFLGGVAQPGERLNGIQEVNGSIPSVSTNSPEPQMVWGIILREL